MRIYSIFFFIFQYVFFLRLSISECVCFFCAPSFSSLSLPIHSKDRRMIYPVRNVPFYRSEQINTMTSQSTREWAINHPFSMHNRSWIRWSLSCFRSRESRSQLHYYWGSRKSRRKSLPSGIRLGSSINWPWGSLFSEDGFLQYGATYINGEKNPIYEIAKANGKVP